ncbi:hypothetical protein FGG08_003130 [Glutinoglossum americanum]|uniref:Uncharacterized protein n=1 Tax=Glutinoglossum americanum TaxID=1670608 RepID=A0A9P8I3C3_9PEZI|nr:hypothetical protein FGG08_003130 [Glutinoglossum americanum]
MSSSMISRNGLFSPGGTPEGDARGKTPMNVRGGQQVGPSGLYTPEPTPERAIQPSQQQRVALPAAQTIPPPRLEVTPLSTQQTIAPATGQMVPRSQTPLHTQQAVVPTPAPAQQATAPAPATGEVVPRSQTPLRTQQAVLPTPAPAQQAPALATGQMVRRSQTPLRTQQVVLPTPAPTQQATAPAPATGQIVPRSQTPLRTQQAVLPTPAPAQQATATGQIVPRSQTPLRTQQVVLPTPAPARQAMTPAPATGEMVSRSQTPLRTQQVVLPTPAPAQQAQPTIPTISHPPLQREGSDAEITDETQKLFFQRIWGDAQIHINTLNHMVDNPASYDHGSAIHAEHELNTINSQINNYNSIRHLELDRGKVAIPTISSGDEAGEDEDMADVPPTEMPHIEDPLGQSQRPSPHEFAQDAYARATDSLMEYFKFPGNMNKKADLEAINNEIREYNRENGIAEELFVIPIRQYEAYRELCFDHFVELDKRTDGQDIEATVDVLDKEYEIQRRIAAHGRAHTVLNKLRSEVLAFNREHGFPPGWQMSFAAITPDGGETASPASRPAGPANPLAGRAYSPIGPVYSPTRRPYSPAGPAYSPVHSLYSPAHSPYPPAGPNGLQEPPIVPGLIPMPRMEDLRATMPDLNAGITPYGKIIGCRRQGPGGHMLLKAGTENFPLYSFKKGSDIGGRNFAKLHYKNKDGDPNKGLGVLSDKLTAKQILKFETTDRFSHVFAVASVERDMSIHHIKHSVMVVGCAWASGATGWLYRNVFKGVRGNHADVLIGQQLANQETLEAWLNQCKAQGVSPDDGVTPLDQRLKSTAPWLFPAPRVIPIPM